MADNSVTTSEALFAHDRDLDRRYVCGVDEAGRAAWAGPLVAAAVRFDYHRLDAETIGRLEYLNDSKKVTPRRRAALLPVILEVADMTTVVVVSAAGIDHGGGVDVSNKRALSSALGAVALAESANLVDWYELDSLGVPHQRIEGGDGKSAAIAAASIVAKETRDQLMRGLDAEYPEFGFAAHKGYSASVHAAAIQTYGLSRVHRRSIRCKAYPLDQLDSHVAATSPPRATDATSTKSSAKGAKSWRDLPNTEKAAHLLATPTITDSAWTDERRLPGESRPAFIARILT